MYLYDFSTIKPVICTVDLEIFVVADFTRVNTIKICRIHTFI